jgi:pimeloyl-ACP methyl ester carboxylesterase
MKRISTNGWSLLAIFLAGGSVICAQAPAKSKVEMGEINGAAFRIEIPENWNRGLVMYAHGYTQPDYKREPPQSQASRDIFLSRGFAFAESAYSAQGWAVKEGIEDTEMLRRYFVSHHGKPQKTYVTGDSMGGHITIATIERYPDEYNGALPLCGPLISSTEFFNYGVFDLLVTFDYFFPNVIGSPFEAIPDTAEKVRAALQAAPDKAVSYSRRVHRTVERLPGVIALYQRGASELKQRAGGNPFDNTNYVYAGFGDDAAMNRGIKRYSADPAAREYMKRYYSPTGRIADPVLTLAVTGDQAVLPQWTSQYGTLALQAGTQDLFVARFVDGTGHCGFKLEQVGRAFDTLVLWEREGKRPATGEQK